MYNVNHNHRGIPSKKIILFSIPNKDYQSKTISVIIFSINPMTLNSTINENRYTKQLFPPSVQDHFIWMASLFSGLKYNPKPDPKKEESCTFSCLSDTNNNNNNIFHYHDIYMYTLYTTITSSLFFHNNPIHNFLVDERDRNRHHQLCFPL